MSEDVQRSHDVGLWGNFRQGLCKSDDVQKGYVITIQVMLEIEETVPKPLSANEVGR